MFDNITASFQHDAMSDYAAPRLPANESGRAWEAAGREALQLAAQQRKRQSDERQQTIRDAKAELERIEAARSAPRP